MIKSELIQKIATANPHLFHRDIEKIVNVLFEEIVGAMARGDRVELRGFGAFTVKHRAPRTGRNPRTGATVSVGEKFVPFFKTGKELRERLNDKPVGAKAGRKPRAAAQAGDQTGTLRPCPLVPSTSARSATNRGPPSLRMPASDRAPARRMGAAHRNLDGVPVAR